MSHTVTVTRTTTTSSTTAILLNSGYLKTIPGLLKLLQTVLGATCLGLIVHYTPSTRYSETEYTFFLLMVTTFFIATAINLISCLLSITTATLLPKSMFELLYHSIAFVLYIAASVALIVRLDKYHKYTYNYEPLMATGVIGLIVSALYLISAVYSYRGYKGL